MLSSVQNGRDRLGHERQPAFGSPLSVRAGSGLGDALYLQSVARHLVEEGRQVEVCCNWPEVFQNLPVSVVPFRRFPVDRNAHYSMRRHVKETTQFQDCCLQAGLRNDVDLRLDWAPRNAGLIDSLKAYGRKIVCVQIARAPFARTDGFGRELLPDQRRIQDAIDYLKGEALVVLLGCGESQFKFDGIDVDLSNKTTVSDLIDVASCADAFLGYCSFFIPLAESLNKPAVFVWSRKGLSSPHEVVRQITPQKILHKRSSRAVFDDCSAEELGRAIDATLCQ